MQSITTKFLCPTHTKGSRYKASCDAGSLTLVAQCALNSEQNHVRVARALIEKLGWWHDAARGDRYGDWYSGGTKDGYVFVCAVEDAKVTANEASGNSTTTDTIQDND